eukprot:gene11244-12424_t
MSLSNGSSELDLENEACGSGSKLSDDSGIEDTWNEDNSQSKNSKMEKNNGDEANQVGGEFSFASFTPLTPPEEPNQQYGPENIYPAVPSYSPALVTKTDKRDENALPGVCGIENLGNTCFMNAGLQCLFASSLLHQFLPNDKSPGLVVHAENSKAMVQMVDRFQEIFKKVLSGNFSSLYPSEFHSALTQVHAIFGDHKQHDCQEFLSFFLNGLHDALNRVNARKRLQDDGNTNSRESSPHLSDLRLGETSSSDSETDDCVNDTAAKNTATVTLKRRRLNDIDAEPDVGVECDGKLSEAQISWRSYVKQNRSVIVDNFQGQFKSMRRTTMLETYDIVGDVRHCKRHATLPETYDIAGDVICEKCRHMSNTYEPFMHVSVPVPYSNEQQVVVIWHGLSNILNPSQVKRYLITVTKNACVGDVKRKLIEVLQKEDLIDANTVIMAEVSKSSIVRTLVCDMQLKFLNAKADRKLYAIQTRPRSNESSAELEQQNTSDDLDSNLHNSVKTDHNSDAATEEPMDEDSRSNGDTNAGRCSSIATGWHTCGICLEDIFDDDLMIHQPCGGMLCRDCLLVTCSYHCGKSFPCPVCNATVDEKTYRPVTDISSGEVQIRTILVPLLMRFGSGLEDTHEAREKVKTPAARTETFGHPSIFLLPSKVEASEIYERVREMFQSKLENLQYSLLFTDSQGANCSRCDTFADCSGCCVPENEAVQLRPGDHLTIHFSNISQQCIESFSAVANDESLSLLRNSDVIQLSECFKFFSECEILSEENPWFCPKCRRNQVATKSISISRWPDALIVHLKR